jgi:uncharacterized membrane protein
MNEQMEHRDELAPLELLVLLFNRAGAASQALQMLKKGNNPGPGTILDSAVLIRNPAGETFLFETGHIDSRHGVLFGTVLGVLLGVVSQLSQGDEDSVPATQEDAFAVWTELGLADETLSRLQSSLRPGGSALLLLAEQGRVEQRLRGLAELEGPALEQVTVLPAVGNPGSHWEGET